MPVIKDYECETCGWVLEKWHVENTEHEPPICPDCMIPAKQVLTAPNVTFRGMGWAKDGYSKDIDDAEIFWHKEGKPVGKHVDETIKMTRKQVSAEKPVFKKKTPVIQGVNI